MKPPRTLQLREGAVALGVFTLPLLGAALASRDLRDIFCFPPPLEIPVGYLRFSWLAGGAVLALLAAIAVSWLRSRRGVSVRATTMPRGHAVATHRFPLWGHAALAWTLAWWVLAWTRFGSFEPLQRYTFFPLWMGFIVTVNALTFRLTGTCTMVRKPRAWLTLFVASAVFWWAFEWLNRFVRNWHYLAVEDFGPLGYALHASLCFSTVLPAVAAVAEWLGAHPRWMNTTAAGPRWRWLATRPAGLALVSGGIVALAATGAYPRWCYPALWIAPLALWLGCQILSGSGSVAREMSAGDWTRAATWMVAALICGFFWELWNWQSLAKWIYTVPGVERWHVFEMPLLGYAGYFPFGLECLLVAERILPAGVNLRTGGVQGSS